MTNELTIAHYNSTQVQRHRNGAPEAPRWNPKDTKWSPTSATGNPKKPKVNQRSPIGSQGKPKRPRGAQETPGGAQETTKGAQEGAKMAQERSKGDQVESKVGPEMRKVANVKLIKNHWFLLCFGHPGRLKMTPRGPQMGHLDPRGRQEGPKRTSRRPRRLVRWSR